MIEEKDILRQWNIISDVWKSSDRQNWFHKFILEPFFVDYLSTNFPNKGQILDYGCGSGELLKILTERGFNVSGFEPSIKLYERAEKNSNKLFNVLGQEHSNYYDLIILNLVLSSVTRPIEVLQSTNRLLKPNGRMMITIPHPCFSILGQYHSTTRREWLLNYQADGPDILKYFSNPIQKIFWSLDTKHFTYTFYRTIEWYSELFLECNLTIKNIYEPKARDDFNSKPDLNNLFSSSFPSFMIFIVNA